MIWNLFLAINMWDVTTLNSFCLWSNKTWLNITVLNIFKISLVNLRAFFSQLSVFPDSWIHMNDSNRRITVAPPSRWSTAAIFHGLPRVRARHAGRGARKRPLHSWACWSYTVRFPTNYIPDRARNTTSRRRPATIDKITHGVTLFSKIKGTWISNFNIAANMHLSV